MNAIKSLIKTVVLSTALAVAGMAHAALVPQVSFVELGFDALGVPAHEAERFTISPCQGCEPQTVKLTSATVYRISGHRSAPVTFKEFRQAVSAAEDKSLLLFYVGYANDTNHIVELVLGAGE